MGQELVTHKAIQTVRTAGKPFYIVTMTFNPAVLGDKTVLGAIGSFETNFLDHFEHVHWVFRVQGLNRLQQLEMLKKNLEDLDEIIKREELRWTWELS